MRHTRAHRDNRRAHHALEGSALTVCPNCGAKMQRHTACQNCGQYKGRAVVDVHAELRKKQSKKNASSETAAEK
ncbi:MAG TPA: 50S ribosomal protein L32 [Candidatus Paceibacterota bacterium]|nr:50S ribosomal protein L32 [Candidatus Paceibacterota bacterium]